MPYTVVKTSRAGPHTVDHSRPAAARSRSWCFCRRRNAATTTAGQASDRRDRSVFNLPSTGRLPSRKSAWRTCDDGPSAVELFEQAAELRPITAVRARYNDAAHLLEAQVAVNAWHDAEATIPTVLAGTDDISSARTSDLLRRVLQRIERAQGHLPSGLDDGAHELRQVLRVA